MNRIKKEAESPMALKGAQPQKTAVGLTASTPSISEDSENVNGKFSLSSEVEEQDGRTKLPDFDAEVSVKKKYMEQTDTRQFKRWFRGSEAVNADGTPKVFYHGTPNGTFNTFRNWQYFTENKAYADGYQNQGASSIGYKKTAENKKTYAVYLQTGKVFDTRNSAEREIFENEFYGKWGNGTPLSERGLPDWTDGDDLIEFFDENGYDYDTILLDEGGTGGYGEDVKDRGISYVIKDSSQIKSATDNVGTFDPENPDIRYSINEKNGQTQLPDVTEDAELYAQAASDADMRAALMLVQRLNKLFAAMDDGTQSVGDLLMYARETGKKLLDSAEWTAGVQDETTQEALRILKTNKFYLTEDMKSEIRGTFRGFSCFPALGRPGLLLFARGGRIFLRAKRRPRMRAASDCQKIPIPTLGMHEGAAAPSFLIRRTGFAGSRSGRNDRFLYHFLPVKWESRMTIAERRLGG